MAAVPSLPIPASAECRPAAPLVPSDDCAERTNAVDLLRMMLPLETREILGQLPPDVQNEFLQTGAEVLSDQGVGEALQSLTRSMRGDRKFGGSGPGDDSWHGLLAAGRPWESPQIVASSEESARPGYNAGNASEFMDSPDVLRSKAQLLAQMWRRSGNRTVLYTGAGLSTASGIGDYASKASKSIAPHKTRTNVGSRLDLSPTVAHHALAAIEEKGLIGNWVQQNHDRLAQKAGFPQAKLNEIHGAWGDMKNPVKMMDDTLRDDLMHWLIAWAEHANMCVALGTSLCGMNADQVPRGAAERFEQSSGEGLVIIGLQRTVYDDVASLRIWGLCDDVMKLVAKELGCKVPSPRVAERGRQWQATHPRCTYNTPKRTAATPL